CAGQASTNPHWGTWSVQSVRLTASPTMRGHCTAAVRKTTSALRETPPSMACTRPPSAPRNVISSINETSVILDWSWPEDTGGRRDITFTVLCKRCRGVAANGSNGGAQRCEPCRSNVRFLPRATGLHNTTVTVVDLLAHTNYTFEIEAQNGVSSLAPKMRQYAAVTITTNQAAPSPVTVIRKEKTSRNSVSLSWQEPERPNGIILDYEIKYYEKEEQETSYTILRARGCNVTLNGLKPNTAYLLQIRARTAAGYGASSPSFQFETSPDSAFSISSESSQVVLIAISSAVAIILLTVLLYVLIGRPGWYQDVMDPHTYEDPSQLCMSLLRAHASVSPSTKWWSRVSQRCAAVSLKLPSTDSWAIKTLKGGHTTNRGGPG
ncbi:ephrin type-A receptor 3 isoform X1, partial [Lates japonicus]